MFACRIHKIRALSGFLQTTFMSGDVDRGAFQPVSVGNCADSVSCYLAELLLTTHALYNFEPSKYSKPNRAMRLRDMTGLVVSTQSLEMLVQMGGKVNYGSCPAALVLEVTANGCSHARFQIFTCSPSLRRHAHGCLPSSPRPSPPSRRSKACLFAITSCPSLMRYLAIPTSSERDGFSIYRTHYIIQVAADLTSVQFTKEMSVLKASLDHRLWLHRRALMVWHFV